MLETKPMRYLMLTLLSATTSVQAAPPLATSPFYRVDPSAVPTDHLDGDLKLLRQALNNQIETCKQQNLSEKRVIGSRKVTRQAWCLDTGRAMLSILDQSKSVSQAFEKARAKFEWYQSEGSDGQGLVTFTGYNSPTLHGSLHRTSKYRYPIYSRPKDLVQITEDGKQVWRRKTSDGRYVPYYKRAEIDSCKSIATVPYGSCDTGDADGSNGALAGRGLELAYVDDLFSVTVVQIEGSGFIELDNGKRLHLNYAAQNGYSVTTPRKTLQSEGVPDEYLTIPGMRRYFREHPDKLVPTLLKNESYIFFDASDNDVPRGVDGIAVTGLHSIAVDLKIFPVGVLTFFGSQKPIPNSAGDDAQGFEPYNRFGLTQDTGGAIKGPGRVDVYWGEDQYAEIASGTTNHPGKIFVALLPE